MPLELGHVLQERYCIDELLGQGGMGAVYRGTDLRFNTPVAVKENRLATPESQRQFAREAGLLHQLRHPNLPQVSDHFTIPGQGQYLVMDYIDGQDLGQIIAQQGAIPETQAQAWMGQVLDALEYLHGERIVHRDIKPANVKITPQGQAFLVDFGLAKVYDPLLETTMGARGVTPGYAPPEQYSGPVRTDARSDLYSVGATLYALLTGRPPPDSVDLMLGHATLAPPRELNPAISARAEAAILKAMQPRPTDRPQAVSELRTALAPPPFTLAVDAPRAAAGAAVLAPVAARPQRAALPVWALAGGAAAFLVLIAIVAGVMLMGDGQDGVVWTPETSWTAVATVALTRTPGPAATPISAATTRPVTEVPTPSATSKPTNTAGAPAVAPSDSGRIAFHSDRDGDWDIYVMDGDGSGLMRLTDSPADESASAWSPDGTRIAFTSDRDGNDEIYVMNADGSGLMRLTDNEAGDVVSSWSPDGMRIAFYSDRDGDWDIHVMNADGSNSAPLTDNPDFDGAPDWSPDGTRIAFGSLRDGSLDIYVMNADGSGLIRLTDNPDEDWAPVWSPDGTRIAFMSGSGMDDWEIYVMDAGGSGLTCLTENPGFDGAPDWSPDGTRIVFRSDRDGNDEIYAMDADGGRKTRLTNDPGSDGVPVWLP